MALQELLHELDRQLDGTVRTDITTLDRYSSDASPFRVSPSAVIYPAHHRDLQTLVRFVNRYKALYPDLSLTMRGAGTCRSGGPLNDSFIVDMSQFTSTMKLKGTVLTVEPGVSMQAITDYLAASQRMLGAAPTHHAHCTIGGMIANNSGGAWSYRYGNIVKNVQAMTVILADGSQHSFGPLTKQALKQTIDGGGFIADVYRELRQLLHHYGETIDHLRPRTTKNATGYNLWDIYDETTKTYNFAKLLCGSQGTLGIITSITLQTDALPQHTGNLWLAIEQPKKLTAALSLIQQSKPLGFEGFDDVSLRLGIKYFPRLTSQFGLAALLKKESNQIKKTLLPYRHPFNLLANVCLEGSSPPELANKLNQLQTALQRIGIASCRADEEPTNHFWQQRRGTMQLLQQKMKDTDSLPLLDDMVIEPRFIGQFLPRMQRLLRRYKIPAITAGHIGDGNFHLIPLVELPPEQLADSYEALLRELVTLVADYGGTLAGEHNDGLLRSPWLRASYGELAFELFRDTKQIFDPMNIFNPHKKTDASLADSQRYLAAARGTDQLIIVKNS